MQAYSGAASSCFVGEVVTLISETLLVEKSRQLKMRKFDSPLNGCCFKRFEPDRAEKSFLREMFSRRFSLLGTMKSTKALKPLVPESFCDL